MRHHVVRFLLETEQSYVQSLRTIIKVLSPLLSSLLLSSPLFSSLLHTLAHLHTHNILLVLWVPVDCTLQYVPSDKGLFVMGCGFLPISSHVFIAVSLTSRRE